MRLLIDTCVVLWAMTTPERLSARVRSLFEDRANDVLVSVVSAWEIGIKRQAGRLELAPTTLDFFRSAVRDHSLGLLPVSLEHAVMAAELPLHHRDPFDRMLIAQAVAEGIAIASPDHCFTAYPVNTVW